MKFLELISVVVIAGLLHSAQGTPTPRPREESPYSDLSELHDELGGIENGLARYDLKSKINSLRHLIPALKSATKSWTDLIRNARPENVETLENQTNLILKKVKEAEELYGESRAVEKKFPMMEQTILGALNGHYRSVLDPRGNKCVDDNTTTDYTQTRFTACGGVVPLRLNEEVEITYKMNQNYASNEFCVWSFVPESPATAFTFNPEIIPFRQLNQDGIAIYSWNGGDSLEVVKKPLSTITVQGQHVFMSFSSDGDSTVANGFRVRVTATSDGSPATTKTYSATSLSQRTGNVTVPKGGNSCSKNNEMVSTVLEGYRDNNGNLVNRMIGLTDMDIGTNKVYVHQLRTFTEVSAGTLRGTTFTGTHQGLVPGSSITTRFPVIFLYESDDAGSGQGYSIVWRNPW